MNLDDGAARDRLGAALRALLDAVVTTSAPPDDLAALADELDAVTARLGEHAPPPTFEQSPSHPYSLVGGTAHPVAPQLRTAETGDGVSGTVTLGPVFEGGPGLVHGGIIALLLDHAMGHAVFAGGHVAMTRTLDLHYDAPTPLGAELRVAARVVTVTGRRVQVAAELSLVATGAITARADGLFVRLSADNVARIFPAQSADPGSVSARLA